MSGGHTSAHLTRIALDEAAAGLVLQPEDAAHVAACAECRAKVEALSAGNARLLVAPHAVRVRKELAGRYVERPREAARRRLWIPALSAAVAAVLLFLMLPRTDLSPPPADRLKGGPAVYVLKDGRWVERARAGDKVALMIANSGRSHAAVFAIEPSGEVTPLWPRAGETAQAIQPGLVLLERAFEVTAGDTALVAAMVDGPSPLGELRAKVKAAADAARAEGLSPLDAAPEALAGETWVRTRLEVR